MSDATPSLEAIAAELSRTIGNYDFRPDCEAELKEVLAAIRSHAQKQSKDTKRLESLRQLVLDGVSLPIRFAGDNKPPVWCLWNGTNETQYDTFGEVCDALRSESKGGQG